MAGGNESSHLSLNPSTERNRSSASSQDALLHQEDTHPILPYNQGAMKLVLYIAISELPVKAEDDEEALLKIITSDL